MESWNHEIFESLNHGITASPQKYHICVIVGRAYKPYLCGVIRIINSIFNLIVCIINPYHEKAKNNLLEHTIEEGLKKPEMGQASPA
jgi:hypothetical protein